MKCSSQPSAVSFITSTSIRGWQYRVAITVAEVAGYG